VWPEYSLGNAFPFFYAVGLLFQMFNGSREVTTRTATGVENLFTQLGVHHFADKLRNGSWGVELATFTRTLQFFQNGLVEFSKSMAVFSNVEVNFIELVQHLADVYAAFHVVVIAFKHFTHQQ